MTLSVLSDEHFMKLALAEAQEAYDKGEVPVGAVVVVNNEIVGSGFNRTRTDNDPSAHAEVVAIREAAKRTLGQRHYDVQLLGGMVLHQGKISHTQIHSGTS